MLLVNEKRNENRNSRKKHANGNFRFENTIEEILKSLDDLNYRMET